ncbi:MAG: hypothetical protein A3J28_06190 [Acidobacteria bacterium RIFCSPLOWO2_12_FULL_60_22]|nr:MAG: hypothetical protein A3J28_06190 [Acidobacteria bacterium RIFCSPLOWO2_12_FULL_60_22]
MMIFKKAIPRRAFLRGLGATIALPLLDGMVPAFAGALDTAAKPALRISYVYLPNGMIRDSWLPATEGANFEMTPCLKELAAFRNQMVVLSGLDGGPEFVGGHQRGSAMWLTGAEPKKSLNDVHAGISVDQVLAREFGKHTQVDSLELCIEDAAEIAGQSNAGYNAAYTNTISWRSPVMPLFMEHKPRAVFERLFGDGESTEPAARLARIRKSRSILDFVSEDAARVLAELGANDRTKVSEFLDAIRDVETRVQKAEENASVELPKMERPVGIPAYEDHVKLMFDLLVLAFQTDMTRVSTFMLAREYSELVYTNLGITEPHHPLTHHRGIPERIEQTRKIDIYHTKLFAYFLERMRSTRDGDGSLLDHSLIVYGAGMGDGDIHNQWNMPIALLGGGMGKIKKGGLHLQYPKGTPFSNLHVATLNLAGMQTEKFGISTGPLDLGAVT